MKNRNETMPQILEAALFAAGEPLNIERLALMFEEAYRPTNDELRETLKQLTEFYKDRGVELKEVASGFRFQSRVEYASWLQKLWEKRPPRYSRALLETIALVAYKQPITRGEIEDVRGVVVSSNVMKTLLEREWVKIVGYKDVPGKPALYATTKEFLDYFNFKNLSDLPPLQEVVNFEELEKRLGEQLTLGVDLQAANDGEVLVTDDRDWLGENEDDEEIIEVNAEQELAVMQLVESIEQSFVEPAVDSDIESEDMKKAEQHNVEVETEDEVEFKVMEEMVEK